MAPSTVDSKVRAGLERFLFAPVNPRGAAMFRGALAIILAVAFWPGDNRPGGVTEWLPGSAVLYDQVFLTGPYWLLILVGLVLLGVGWRPRPLGLLLAALLAPLALLQHGQLSRHILLLTLAFFSLVRSDAQYSPKVWLGGAPALSAGPIWPIRLIQLQLSALYGVNALAKTTPAYLSGEVFVGMSRMLTNFHLDLADGFQHLGPLVLPCGSWRLRPLSPSGCWRLASGSVGCESGWRCSGWRFTLWCDSRSLSLPWTW